MLIGRHSLIFGLSYALDILGENSLSHSKSTAYLSVLIGRELNLDIEETRSIYYTALLHDIGYGCYESDKHGVYSADIRLHCIVGSEMVEKLPLPSQISQNILYHHESYDGLGPFGLRGDEIPIGAQIVFLADSFDNKFGEIDDYDRAVFLSIKEWINSSSYMFSAKVIEAISSLIEREYVLFDYFNHEIKYTLSHKINVDDKTYYNTEDIVKFAHCFAEIIDTRSPFTFSHSTGIADLARKSARYLGYSAEVQSKMYIAGLLHDIGKMHISTDILHKDGPLTSEERFEMNKHTYYTRMVLEQIDGFGDIVNIAANHHEKLDGTGYPYKIHGRDLSELERVMAICDVYQALTEKRPYRASMPAERAWDIIGGMVKNQHLDADLAEKLKHVLTEK